MFYNSFLCSALLYSIILSSISLIFSSDSSTHREVGHSISRLSNQLQCCAIYRCWFILRGGGGKCHKIALLSLERGMYVWCSQGNILRRANNLSPPWIPPIFCISFFKLSLGCLPARCSAIHLGLYPSVACWPLKLQNLRMCCGGVLHQPSVRGSHLIGTDISPRKKGIHARVRWCETYRKQARQPVSSLSTLGWWFSICANVWERKMFSSSSFVPR